MEGISAKSKVIKKKKDGNHSPAQDSGDENPELPTNPKEEAWHLEVLNIEESSIPKDLFTLKESNIFAGIIHPLTPKQFYTRYFARRALVIKGGSAKRFNTIVKD